MNADQLRALLQAVAKNEVAIPDAMEHLRRMPFEELPFASVDHHRALRCGHPEVIFCQNKTAGHVLEIARRLRQDGQRVLATRVTAEQMTVLREAFGAEMLVDDLARAVLIGAGPEPQLKRNDHGVIVACAGTSDLPVAREAMITLRSLQVPAQLICDVGVSGLHRLLAHVEKLQQACAIVCVAGMEGALASVLGGLVACPVFAVPTSVGYGAHFGGVATLLTMLNSCASNISVVNIDNGFGGAFSAGLVYRNCHREEDHG